MDELIGRRVALRHRVATDDGRPLFTDSVGELTDDGPVAVLVHTRRGVVRVERNAVVAVRAIPPARPRRASLGAIARLEYLCADAWPAPLVRELGGWRLRAAGGFTGRANSALAVGDPGVPIADALSQVVEFAHAHELRPLVQVAIDTPWQRAITGHGWVLHADHPAGANVAVLVAPLDELPDGSVARMTLSIDDEPGDGWWELSGDHPISEPQRQVLLAPDVTHTGFGTARTNGEVVGAVRAVVLEDHLFISRLEVDDRYRRRGLGTALMAAAAHWSRPRGGEWCVLQVSEHNEPAIALYRRLGFTVHHRYQYLRPPDLVSVECGYGHTQHSRGFRRVRG